MLEEENNKKKNIREREYFRFCAEDPMIFFLIQLRYLNNNYILKMERSGNSIKFIPLDVDIPLTLIVWL